MCHIIYRVCPVWHPTKHCACHVRTAASRSRDASGAAGAIEKYCILLRFANSYKNTLDRGRNGTRNAAGK